MGNFVTSSPNEVVLVSGPTGTSISVGRTTYAFWVINKVARLNLSLHTLELYSRNAQSVQGVHVSVYGIAQVRIRARVHGVAADGSHTGEDKLDIPALLRASQHFLGNNDDEIKNSLRQTLEGHQRQVIGTLTIEQIYRDREALISRVTDLVDDDLERLGFDLVSYVILQVQDDKGYMDALGKTQVSHVKREAAQGRSMHESEAKVKVAQAVSRAEIEASRFTREAHVEANTQAAAIAESQQILDVKIASMQQVVSKAQVEADSRARIAAAYQAQEIGKQTMQQRFVQKEVETMVAKQEAELNQAAQQGIARAEFAANVQDAKAITLTATAESERIRTLARAEADATLLKGTSDAHNLKLRSEALSKFGDAALSKLVVDRLPEICKEIAEPLGKAEKLVFVSAGGEGGMGGLASTLSQTQHAVEALTGFSLAKAVGNSQDKAEEKREEFKMEPPKTPPPPVAPPAPRTSAAVPKVATLLAAPVATSSQTKNEVWTCSQCTCHNFDGETCCKACTFPRRGG